MKTYRYLSVFGSAAGAIPFEEYGAGEHYRRLAAWQRNELSPGEGQRITLPLQSRKHARKDLTPVPLHLEKPTAP